MDSASGRLRRAIKASFALLGIGLYCTTPARDALFYRTILDNEGFGTTRDSIAIPIAGSLIATTLGFPIAAFLIIYGICASHRLQILPRLDRLSVRWGMLASLLLIPMLLIESDYVIYSIRHPHHWKTLLASLAYLAFIYVWWCCSLAHGEVSSGKEKGE